MGVLQSSHRQIRTVSGGRGVDDAAGDTEDGAKDVHSLIGFRIGVLRCTAAWRAEVDRQRAAEPDPPQRRYPPLGAVVVVYVHGHTRQALPLAEVEERYGPVRPVVAPDAADVERLQELVRDAGRLALGTIAAALYAVEQRIAATQPSRIPAGGAASAEGLIERDPLTAGRPGSREAVDLIAVIWQVGPAVLGDQVHAELHAEAIEIFLRWATGRPTSWSSPRRLIWGGATGTRCDDKRTMSIGPSR
ncbi:hypothetical protein [Actinomadura verrucosospora]